MKNAKQFADEIQEFWARADAENRDLTAQERIELSELIVRAKSQQDIEGQLKGLDRTLPSGSVHMSGDQPHGGSPGDVFVASKGYQRIADPTGRGRSWSSGLVELPLMQPMPADSYVLMKGTMLEGTGSPGSGTGGGFLGAPQVVPGVVDKLFQPLSIETLLRPGRRPATPSGTRPKAPLPPGRRVWLRAA